MQLVDEETVSLSALGAAERDGTLRSHVGFIVNLCTHIDVGRTTMCTAIVYVQRYLYSQPNEARKRRNLWIVCTAATFLACKVDYVKRKMRDVLCKSWNLYNRLDSERDVGYLSPHDAERYQSLRAQLTDVERELLILNGFDFNIEHAYTKLVENAEAIFPATGSEVNRLYFQFAWSTLHDVYTTSLPLVESAATLAVVALTSSVAEYCAQTHSDGSQLYAALDVLCSQAGTSRQRVEELITRVEAVRANRKRRR